MGPVRDSSIPLGNLRSPNKGERLSVHVQRMTRQQRGRLWQPSGDSSGREQNLLVRTASPGTGWVSPAAAATQMLPPLSRDTRVWASLSPACPRPALPLALCPESLAGGQPWPAGLSWSSWLLGHTEGPASLSLGFQHACIFERGGDFLAQIFL